MENVKYLLGEPNICNLPMRTYGDDACEFSASLSETLLKNSAAKQFSDIMSFAFWCRKGNISKLKKNFGAENNRLGRGLVFHVAPSNVPVNFAFSFMFSLLAGNANIVRIPSNPFTQIEIICETIESVLKDFPEIKRRTAFVSYPVDTQITAAFSAMADARMIWGGDSTIEAVRMQNSRPRCVDIVFADRYSICIIDGRAILNADGASIMQLAKLFYNDTYLMDQNACSSPQLVLWQNSGETAKNRFWNTVSKYVSAKYELQAAIAVDKFTQFCENAIDMGNLHKIHRDGNYLYRAELSSLSTEDVTCLRGKGGYFYEYDINSFDDIASLITEKYQTVSYYGISASELRDYVLSSGLRGIDRIVPIGSAMDIGVVWDGYDIIGMLSRIVSVN